MKNITTKEAAELLLSYDNVAVLMHKSPDGDTIGCAYALCMALRKLGKKAQPFCSDAVSHKMYSYILDDFENQEFDIEHIVSVDIADTQLLGSKLEIFKDKVELCIDHHGSNIGFAEAGVVVPSAAACAEIVKCVIEDMGVEIDSRIADAIFTGLTTDTGCFKYVSVTPATMRIAADMIEKGANSGMINRIMFDTKSRERIEAERLALDSMKFYFDNRIAVVFITKKLLEISGVEESETDGIASIPRQIEGVLAGITIREKDNGICRVSLRTVEGVDASKICSVFGGGGHKAAAGCSIEGTVEQAESKVVKAAQSVIEESL